MNWRPLDVLSNTPTTKPRENPHLHPGKYTCPFPQMHHFLHGAPHYQQRTNEDHRHEGTYKEHKENTLPIISNGRPAYFSLWMKQQ